MKPPEASTPTARDEPRRESRVVWLLALLLLSAASVLVLHPLATSPATLIHDPSVVSPGDAGRADVRLHAWVLARGTAFFTGALDGRFLDANIFHPIPGSFAFSEQLLGVLPFFAPLLLLTRELALSLNLWIVSTFIFSGLSAWWVAYRLFGSHAAGALAGVAFAFVPWRLHTIVHVKLLSVQFVPLIAWAVVEARRRPGTTLWLLLAGCSFLQAASCFYLGYLGYLFGGVLAATCLVFGGSGRLRYALFAGTALSAGALLMLPLSLPYLGTVNQGSIFGPTSANMVTLFGYLYPPHLEPASTGWSVWWALPPLAAFGLVRGLASERHRALAIGLGLAALLGAWLALGPRGVLLGVPVGVVHTLASEWIPGWGSVRVFQRFAILFWFAICFLVPLAVAPRTTAPFGLPNRIGAMLAALLTLGLVGSASLVHIGTEPEPFEAVRDDAFQWLATHGEGDPVLHLPTERFSDAAEYMYLSTVDWSPMVNGYGAYRPPQLTAVAPLLAALPAKPALDVLEQLQLVRWLVIHTDRVRAETTVAWERALPGALRADGEGHRIYELPYADGPSVLLAPPRGKTLTGLPLDALRGKDLIAGFGTGPRTRTARASTAVVLSLRVENRSSKAWPALATNAYGLVGAILEVRGAEGAVVRQSRFHRLPFDLAPRASTVVKVKVAAPGNPGRYSVVPCMVQSGVAARRCSDRDSVTLDVRPFW